MNMIPGISAAITEVNRRIREFSKMDHPVFITGEAGTEKAFAAKVIHQLSHRGPKTFQKISVSWKLPPDLGQRFLQCEGGTLIVNLQREFPIDMQYTLLEMANDRSLTDPMSGNLIQADVRVILTTSLDIDNLMGKTSLLPELTELLERRHIEIPPIRERPEDIPALVRYATNRALETGRSKAKGADAQVLALFRMWRWPGNAEDLLLVTAEAALNTDKELIALENLPAEFVSQVSPEMLEMARSVRLPRYTPPALSTDPGLDANTPPPRQLTPLPIPPAPPTPTLATTPQPFFDEQTPVPEAAEPAAARAEAELDDEARRFQRLVVLARRLNMQSQILSKQMAGPLDRAVLDTSKLAGDDQHPGDVLSEALERELDRSLDAILALRRQLAKLNVREQETIQTARDLYRRLILAGEDPKSIMGDEDIRGETMELAGGLRDMDRIIQRVSGTFPKLGEQLEVHVSNQLHDDEARVIAEAIRRARDREMANRREAEVPPPPALGPDDTHPAPRDANSGRDLGPDDTHPAARSKSDDTQEVLGPDDTHPDRKPRRNAADEQTQTNPFPSNFQRLLDAMGDAENDETLL